MFDFLGRFQRNGSRYCEDCGRRTNYRRCDQCAQMGRGAWIDLDLGAETTPGTPITPTDRAFLAGLPEAAPVADETPISDAGDVGDAGAAGTGEPTPPPEMLAMPLLVAPLGDAFAEQVVWVRLTRESLPPIRDDWSTRCPWCAREMRELCDDTYTHRPRREVVKTCERHHAAQLRLAAWLRSGRFGHGGVA